MDTGVRGREGRKEWIQEYVGGRDMMKGFKEVHPFIPL